MQGRPWASLKFVFVWSQPDATLHQSNAPNSEWQMSLPFGIHDANPMICKTQSSCSGKFSRVCVLMPKLPKSPNKTITTNFAGLPCKFRRLTGRRARPWTELGLRISQYALATWACTRSGICEKHRGPLRWLQRLFSSR